MSDNSLININNSPGDLGKFSEPADTLIKKISKGIGGVFRPAQIKRIAKAEAEAALIKAEADAQVATITAESDIEVANLRQRAVYRLIEEETIHQKRIEDVIVKALPDLNEDADPEAMDDDWIANLFNKCRIVSDNEMQSLWARVLATEANTPGSLSKRTVNILSDFDKNDADLFTKLCGFGWMIGDVVPLVFDEQAEIYNKYGINFGALSHLENIGLIQFQRVGSFLKKKLPNTFGIYYYGKLLRLEMSKNTDNKLQVGKVLLTTIGKELAPICGSTPVAGFYEYVKEQWRQYLSEDEKK